MPRPAGLHSEAVPLDVLVVDDEPLIRWMLRRGLLARGHRVTEAGDAAHALEVLASHEGPFDVVLLDYVLPDRHDLSLLQDVRRNAPRSAIVMMTASADSDLRHAARTIGAWDVIDKPFDVDRLLAMAELAARPDALTPPEAPRV